MCVKRTKENKDYYRRNMMEKRKNWCGFIILLFCHCFLVILLPLSCTYFDPLNPYGDFIYWAKSFGAQDVEEAKAVIYTGEKDFLVAGYTCSFGVAGEDAWIIKLNQDGNILWEKAYGTSMNERFHSIQETSDNNLIITGIYNDISSFWVMKCSQNGDILWEKRFGGIDEDESLWIDETADGGYCVAGRSNSFGTGNGDAIVLKFTSNGNISWIRLYWGSENDGYEEARVIRASDDGTMVFGGNTFSYGAGNSDFWVVKLDGTGRVLWGKTYGMTGEERLCSLTQTLDNGFIITGLSKSLDAVDTPEDEWSYWIIKIDAEGHIQWEKAIICRALTGKWTDYFNAADETEEGRYVVAISTPGSGEGSSDIRVLKFDAEGSVLWQKAYGGAENDHVWAVREAKDGGYIAVGKTCSFDVEKADSWIVKILPNGRCHPLGEDTNMKVVATSCTVTEAVPESHQYISSTDIDSVISVIPAASTVTVTSCTVRQQAPRE
jgi:hypothetical protein